MQTSPPLTDQQRRIVAEIQRVAKKLGVNQLSQDEFDEHHALGGVTTAGNQFGSWNSAVVAAGLVPYPAHGTSILKLTDDALLQDLIRVHKLMGKQPSERMLNAKGEFSVKPYKDRWGSVAKACEIAYQRFGEP